MVGPIHERSPDLIEIDITYTCNLSCFSCDRSCGHAPSSDRLSLQQLQKFIHESIEQGVKWKRIRILGGEPTLHPGLLQIIDELLSFKESHSPQVIIQLITNGYGKRVNNVLAKIDKSIVIENTMKNSSNQYFVPFNLAPKDFASYKYSDFSLGCWIISVCGMGLSPYGYYQCAVAAAIDRVFGFDLGRKSLPDLSDSMRDQMKFLCRYCGHFMTTKRIMMTGDLMSKSWRMAYERYKLSKPVMTFY